MRLRHFHELRPICPACRQAGHEVPVTLDLVEEERGEDVRAGLLRCEGCKARYPILDGLPILVPDVRRFVSDNLFYLTMRRDLSPGVGAALAEMSGPGGGIDAIRQHVSSYGWDHWADQDPAEKRSELAEPGQAARLLHRLLDGVPTRVEGGTILDVGCGAGRTTAELAGRTGLLTLGIDLSVPLARVAQAALVAGRVSYDRRRAGLHFERRDFVVSESPLADVWIADALALPFASESFALVNAINLLDCVTDPRAALAEFGRVLRPGGACTLATPFDWSGAATPFDNWVGGRGAPSGEPDEAVQALATLLSDGPDAAGSLRRSREAEDAPWHVRLHDRSSMRYLAHLVWSERLPAAAESTA